MNALCNGFTAKGRAIAAVKMVAPSLAEDSRPERTGEAGP